MLQYDLEELYRKVWEQPLSKVAEEYGVSAIALGKTCRKLSVPVPGRGHWAKLAFGHEGVQDEQARPGLLSGRKYAADPAAQLRAGESA